MKLYDNLPREIVWRGKKYPLNLAFNRVLEVIDFLNDERFDPIDRVDYCLSVLIPKKHPLSEDLLVAIFDLIFPQKAKKGKKLIDYTQDRGLIIAAFYQAYGIDLNQEIDKLHWITFLDLMQGLPSDTRLAEVVNIRARPMPKPNKHNAEMRAELARLKMEYRLLDTGEDNYKDGLEKIASMLIDMAKRGEKDG